MLAVIQKSAWWRRLLHLVEGFDGPLAFVVFLLAWRAMTTAHASSIMAATC